MREILFRGKGTHSGKWVECDLLNRGYDYQTAIRKVSKGCGEVIGIDPETVGQYTGLTDKNGKKVFEGDILKQKTTPEFAKMSSFEWEHYGIVRFGYYDWNEGKAGYSSVGWYIEPLKSVSINPKDYLVGNIQAGLNQCDILDKHYPMEVIGNIHDNPELLKEEYVI